VGILAAQTGALGTESIMSVKIEPLYKLQKSDIPEAVAVLADAFQHDPIWNKVFEDEPKNSKKLCAFFETPVRYCLKYGEVYATSEKLEGVAAWVPGDLADMTIWRMVRSGAIKSGIKMGSRLAKKMKPAFTPLHADRTENMKGKSFIYLQIIGVASEFQGQGFGGKLIRTLIKKSEQAEDLICLETENNVEMYERFGFKLIKQITLPVINLPMWEMIRDPKAQ